MKRILIVGCGEMGQAWVEYALKRADVQIVGLVDIVIGQAQAYIKEFSLSCPVYTDLGAALHELKPDLVYDTATPEAHFDITSRSLAAGCDVFGEKPMTGDIESAREIVRLAEQSGKTFAVMQNRRYLQPIRNFKELLADDCVGRLATLNADFYTGAHFGGFRDLMDSPLIVDMAIHTFDMARFLSGSNAVSVYCVEHNPPWSWYKGMASAVCIFEMANGCVFTYRGSWCAEGCPTEWEAQWRAIGEFGTAVWLDNKTIYAELMSEPESEAFIRPVKRVEPKGLWSGSEGHNGCFDAMYEALLSGTQPETQCADNIHSMEMVFGAVESARLGRKVVL